MTDEGEVVPPTQRCGQGRGGGVSAPEDRSPSRLTGTMDKKEQEHRFVRDLLERMHDGSDWSLVLESHDVETPDALLIRRDNRSVVGLEVRCAANNLAAEAHGIQRLIGRELLAALRADASDGFHVGLSFYENVALLGKARKRRETQVKAMRELITAHTPIEGYRRLEGRTLSLAGIDCVSAIDLLRSETLGVSSGGGHRHGMGVRILQTYIDEKFGLLGKYAEGARARAGVHSSTAEARFDGVWLLLVAFVGPGMASSIDTEDAESLNPRGLDRVLVLDYWDDCVREVVGRSTSSMS